MPQEPMLAIPTGATIGEPRSARAEQAKKAKPVSVAIPTDATFEPPAGSVELATMRAKAKAGTLPVPREAKEGHPWSVGGLAREAILGGASGLGIPETVKPTDLTLVPGVKHMLAHPIDSAKMAAGMVFDPMAERLARGRNLIDEGGARNTVEGLVNIIAGSIPVVGPAAYGFGEEVGTGIAEKDLQRVAHGIGGITSMILAARKAMPKEIGELDQVTTRAQAIGEGKVRVVNGMFRRPLAALQERVLGDNGEVGKHAQAAIQADEMDMQRKGMTTGQVSTSAAARGARDLLGEIQGKQYTGHPLRSAESLIVEAERGSMTLREVKSLTTDVGKQAAALERAGNAREAAPLWRLYQGLHDASQARANAIGGDVGASWQHYLTETKGFYKLQRGLLGDIMEKHPVDVFDQLTNDATASKNAVELAEIRKWMKKYGVDDTALKNGIQVSRGLADNARQVNNVFVGKIRAITRHPLASGGAAVTGAMLGSATGIPGLGFIVPLIAALKAAHVLDKISVGRILKEIETTTKPSDALLGQEPEGPMPLPKQQPSPTSGAPTGAVPAPSAPPSPIAAQTKAGAAQAAKIAKGARKKP